MRIYLLYYHVSIVRVCLLFMYCFTFFFFYSLQMMQNVENRQNSIVYRWLVCVAHGKLIVHSIKKNSVCKG